MRKKINLLKIKYFIYISKYNILYKYIIYFIYINIKKIFLKEEIIFNYNIFMFKGCFARGNKITVVLCVCITNVRVQISFSPKDGSILVRLKQFRHVNLTGATCY